MNKEKKTTFVLSDESVNTYGFRVLLSGADLEQFRRNPAMFYNHDDWATPIGLWENIRVEDGRLLADPVFDLDDEHGKKIAGKVDRGFLRMASIGFRVVETSDDPAQMIVGQKLPTVTRWQLREVSIVGIGANHNALRLYDANDKLLSDEQILKLFDNPEPFSAHKQKQTMNKETLKILNLTDKSTEDEVSEAVKKLHDSNTQLAADKKQLEKDNKELADNVAEMEKAASDAKKSEAEQLVDKAILDGKLNASAKKETLEFFEASFDAAKKMLEGIPGHKSIKEQLKDADKSELQKLSEKTWDELDKSGELQVLKDKYPDEYEKKHAEKFPKK